MSWTVRALASAALLVSLNATAALRADYEFQGGYASTVAGAPTLTANAGGQTFATDNVRGQSRTVLNFPVGAGLTLSPVSSLGAGSVYTIAMLARLNQVNGYRKFLDFKNRSSDNGLYTYDGLLDFFNFVIGPDALIGAGTYHHIVVTRDAAGTVSGFVDGSLQFSFSDGGGAATVDGSDVLNFLVDDATTTDEQSSGAIARLRVYDEALSPSAVAALDSTPQVSVPVLGTWTWTVALMTLLGLTAGLAIRRRA